MKNAFRGPPTPKGHFTKTPRAEAETRQGQTDLWPLPSKGKFDAPTNKILKNHWACCY